MTKSSLFSGRPGSKGVARAGSFEKEPYLNLHCDVA